MAITKSMPKRYDYQFRLIMLLLLKTICEATIGNKQYSLVYANTDNIPTISKQSTLYTCWSVLPHNIRKSLKNLYVLHPDRGSGIDVSISHHFIHINIIIIIRYLFFYIISIYLCRFSNSLHYVAHLLAANLAVKLFISNQSNNSKKSSVTH